MAGRLKLLASRLLSYLTINGDNLLVGRFLGAVALGTYSLAYNLMFTPMLRVAAPIGEARETASDPHAMDEEVGLMRCYLSFASHARM